MAGKGGARPGAGRKPKAVKHKTAIAEAEERIKSRLPELLDNLFVLACGVKERGENGKVYTKAPDRRANEYLIDRVMGRPTERQELSGPNGDPIPVDVEATIERVYGDDRPGGPDPV